MATCLRAHRLVPPPRVSPGPAPARRRRCRRRRRASTPPLNGPVGASFGARGALASMEITRPRSGRGGGGGGGFASRRRPGACAIPAHAGARRSEQWSRSLRRGPGGGPARLARPRRLLACSRPSRAAPRTGSAGHACAAARSIRRGSPAAGRDRLVSANSAGGVHRPVCPRREPWP